MYSQAKPKKIPSITVLMINTATISGAPLSWTMSKLTFYVLYLNFSLPGVHWHG